MTAGHAGHTGHAGPDEPDGRPGRDGPAGRDGRDGRAGHPKSAGRDGHDYDGGAAADPLMAAVTGEPLPPRARSDAGLRGEYRSAVADVALLREQLGVIAEALVERPGAVAAPAPPPEPARVRPPRPRRRPRRRPLALGTLAVACAGAVAVGLGWPLVRAGGGAGEAAGSGAAADAGAKADASAGYSFGGAGSLACAALVAEGTVTAVERVPGADGYRVTLRVTRAYRTAAGERESVRFVLDGGAVRLHPGDRVLVGSARQGAKPEALFVGEREIAPERAALTAAGLASPAPSCP